MRSLLFLTPIGLAACSWRPSDPLPVLLVSARQQPKLEPTPALKLLDVVSDTGAEVVVILGMLKIVQQAVRRASSERIAFWIGQLGWGFIVQGSSRLQGIVQKNNLTLNEGWYQGLVKPRWTPPNWAFPLAWIPLKVAQTIAAGTLWRRCGHAVFDPAVVMYVLHISLGMPAIAPASHASRAAAHLPSPPLANCITPSCPVCARARRYLEQAVLPEAAPADGVADHWYLLAHRGGVDGAVRHGLATGRRAVRADRRLGRRGELAQPGHLVPKQEQWQIAGARVRARCPVCECECVG